MRFGSAWPYNPPRSSLDENIRLLHRSIASNTGVSWLRPHDIASQRNIARDLNHDMRYAFYEQAVLKWAINTLNRCSDIKKIESQSLHDRRDRGPNLRLSQKCLEMSCSTTENLEIQLPPRILGAKDTHSTKYQHCKPLQYQTRCPNISNDSKSLFVIFSSSCSWLLSDLPANLKPLSALLSMLRIAWNNEIWFFQSAPGDQDPIQMSLIMELLLALLQTLQTLLLPQASPLSLPPPQMLLPLP